MVFVQWMMRARPEQIALACLLLAAPAVFAGAWTPRQGETYLKVAGNIFKSSANFDLEGNRFDPFEDLPDQYSHFRDENLTVYFETGLRDDLALFGSLAYKRIEQETRTATFLVGVDNKGFADVDLGLRYRIANGANVWSVALLAKLPYLYDETDFFALGNGQEDIEARLLFGRSLKRGFYVGMEAAYRFRLEDPSDEYRLLGEAGWSRDKVYSRAKLDVIRSVDDFDSASMLSNPILSPQFDLTKLELTAGVRLNARWNLEYSYTDTLDGKNTADGHNNQLAVVVTF